MKRAPTETARTTKADTEAKRRARAEAKDRRAAAAREALAVLAWNQDHRVGTAVTVRLDNRDPIQTRTRSKAELLGGHTAVVWLENVGGCVLLERVTPAEPRL